MKSKEYYNIYSCLKSEILDGQYLVGKKLPPERQLCQTYRVSRITARHALRLLEEEGLVERFQGSGTFVKNVKPAKLPITELGFAKSVKQFAPTLNRDLLKHGFINSPDEIAKSLNLKETQCFMAIRTDVLNNEVLAFDKVYICSEYCSTLTPEVLKRVDFFEAWIKNEDLKIAFYKETIEAIEVNDEICSILKINKEEPVLKSTEIYYDSTNKPIAVFESFYRGNRIKLMSTVTFKGKNYVRVSDS
jgi:DNA-binding GntR family transcriptional regulator